MKLVQENEDQMLSRFELAKRWGVSKETIKRRERDGLIHPIRLSSRLIRYRLVDILTIEEALAAPIGRI